MTGDLDILVVGGTGVDHIVRVPLLPLPVRDSLTVPPIQSVVGHTGTGVALARWVRLLRPGGRLLLVEGRWWTGGGLTAAETRRLLAPHATQVQTVPLTDPLLWGGPVEDERYLCVATPSS